MTEPEETNAIDITQLPIFTPLPGSSSTTENKPDALGDRAQWFTARPQEPRITDTQDDENTARNHCELDWSLVRALRQQAATRLSEHVTATTTTKERRSLGREVIDQVISEHIRNIVTSGETAISIDQQKDLSQAVFDALFGLGRLQPLIDDPTVENIEVYGAEPVVVIDSDGVITRRPPIADTEDELIDMLMFLATRGGTSERTFSTASPSLHLHLHGGHRLAASGWTTHQPVVAIRRHRLVDVDLEDLTKRATLDQEAEQFLRAAVQARKSIIVSGSMGAGKTTLIRALANEIHPEEKLGTIETEYELGLHHMRDRHQRIIAWEARPGSGERTDDGRTAGEITLDDLVFDALRMNLDRLIVGEVRGREVLPMFKAMQAGAGSLSTIHAHSARAAIERLVTCAMEAGSRVTAEFAYRQIAQHINLIVHIERQDIVEDDGTKQRHRYVTEIIAVEPGENGMPALTDVFASKSPRSLTPVSSPSWMDDLASYGYTPKRWGHVL